MADRAVKYLIIGAGPTGLGAGYTLKNMGETDFLLLEKGAQAGGLASSMVDPHGFTWDIGGHVHFSHYGEYDKALEDALPKELWNSFDRESWVWMYDRFIPYPLQNNVSHMPPLHALRSLHGLASARMLPNKKPNNFLEWNHATFGRHITTEFMLPYNEKVWAHPAYDMSYTWLRERVAVPSLLPQLAQLLSGKRDTRWGPNSTFRFPRAGGTGALWSAVASRIGNEHIALNEEVVAIDTDKKRVYTSSGVYAYEHLLSTMPLPLLTARITPVLSSHAHESASALIHASSYIIGLGLRGQAPEHLRRKSWMYFPESKAPFYRATVFSNYSDTHTPDPALFWSLMTETSGSSYRPVTEAGLEEAVLEGAIATGLIRSRDEVVSVWKHHEPYGYPVPTRGRDAALLALQSKLSARGVSSRGRFGGWKYEVSNQDHSFMQGAEWARKVTLGECETILFKQEV